MASRWHSRNVLRFSADAVERVGRAAELHACEAVRHQQFEPGRSAWLSPGSTIAFGGGLQVNDKIIDSHRLAGISDDAYNIVALYERGPSACGSRTAGARSS